METDRPRAADAPAPWWKVALAGLPEFLVGLQFLAVANRWHAPFVAKPRDLTLLVQVEFLVIHSTAFLGFLGLWQPENAAGRKTRAVAFWGLFGLYCLMAAAQGLKYLIVFFGLTFVTYLGFFMSWGSRSATQQLVARWAIGFAVFILAVGVFGTPKNVTEWTGRASVLKAGALYFLALAALEFSGLYLRTIPRHTEKIRAWAAQGRRPR